MYRTARFFQQIAVRMRQQDDRFLRVIDHFGRQAGLIVFDQRDFRFSREYRPR